MYKKTYLASIMCGVSLFATNAFAQVRSQNGGNIQIAQPQKNSIKNLQIAPNIKIILPGENITNWGIKERFGNKDHGKIGETLFIEGRDLNPNNIGVEIRNGDRAQLLVRKSGGTSARVEFSIPPSAYTGDITAKLQVIGRGRTLLSEKFGICETPKITSISPSPFLVDSHEIRGTGGTVFYNISGDIFTIKGECLNEINLFELNNEDFFKIENKASFIVKETRSKSYNESQLELSKYSQSQNGGVLTRISGRLKFSNYEGGPTLVVDDVRNVASTTTQTNTPVALLPITIQSVEIPNTWLQNGSYVNIPFVILPSMNGGVYNIYDPFFSDPAVIIRGENLRANAQTIWSIGDVNISVPDINGRVTLPANALSGKICATLKNGAKTCSSQVINVVNGPKITSAPQNWNKLGDIVQHNIPLRQSITISGFDLKPPPETGIIANFTTSELGNFATQCNLDFQIQRFDKHTLTFSFGTPGTTRPANCTEQQENSTALLATPFFVSLELFWEYQGAKSRSLKWSVRGSR